MPPQMYKTCRRAYTAPDEGKKCLVWNARIPDQQEDEHPQSLDQLDPEELPWFKAQSSLVYQFPSVVLVEEVVLRDDLADVNSDEPKTATDIHQKQEHPHIKGKTVKKLTSQTYPKGSRAPQKTVNTSKKQHMEKVPGKLPDQGQQIKGTDESTKQRSTVKWGENHGQHWNGASNIKGKHETKNKGGKGKGAQLLSVLKGSSGNTKQASADGREQRTSGAKPRGVLRRLELDAESFFEFLFSDRWQEGCLVRVLTGRLLEGILHCLTRLERFHDVISYTTIAYFYNKRPLLPCIKTAQDKKEYELVEERVLVEFDCFCPQARPEVITEQLQIMGSLCFPTDEHDRATEQPSISSSKDLGQDSIFQTASTLSGPDGKEQQEIFPHTDTSKKKLQPFIKFKSFSNSPTTSEIPRPEGREGRYRRAFSCPEAVLPLSDKAISRAATQPDTSDSGPCGEDLPLNTSDSGPSGEDLSHINTSGSTPSDEDTSPSSGGSRPSGEDTSLSTSGSRPSGAGILRNRSDSRPSDAGILRNRSDSRPSDAGILRNRSGSMGSHEGKSHDQSNVASDAEKPQTTDISPQQSPDQPITNPSNGKLPPIADLVSYTPQDGEQTPRSSIPNLPPIPEALSRNSSWAMTAAFEEPDSTFLVGMGRQVSTIVDTTYDEKTASSRASLVHGNTLSEDRRRVFSDDQLEHPKSEGRSSSGVQLPPLKCNIRGLTRPLPPHDSCLRAFHMVRQPFWERRSQQQTAFPRIGLPELPVTIDRDWEAEQERDRQDQNYLGLILQDETELIASTTSLQVHPTDVPLTGKDLISRLGMHTSKFKGHTDVTINKNDMSASSSSVASLSTDVEEDISYFHPDPVREKNLLKDVEMMRQEFLVNPSLPNEAKDDPYKRQQQGVKSKVQSLQSKQGQENKQKGAGKETLLDKNMLIPHTFSSLGATPANRPDLLTVPQLFYQEAPTPVSPCNMLKKWDKTPNFYEFYLYLLQKGDSEKGWRATRSDKRQRPDKKIAEEIKHSAQRKKSKRLSRVEQSRKKGTKQADQLQKSKSDASDDEHEEQRKQTKQEALQSLHAHTRIQIAAEERRWKSANVYKKTPSHRLHTTTAGSKHSMESILKQASMGVTSTGVHVLTEEQEKILEDEGYIMSSMDPWHLSVTFAYLAGGVCDSIGVRNDLLRRRERILNLVETSKQTVKLNEAYIKHTLKSAHDKTLGKAWKEVEEVSQDDLKGFPERLHSPRRKAGKEMANLKDMEENFETEEEDEVKKPRVKPKSSSHAAAGHQTDKEEHREEDVLPLKDGRKDTEDDKGTLIDIRGGKHKHKKRKEKKPKQKRRSYVYIDDSKILDTISPDKLFKLIGLNDHFNPQKLHSAYSFEKIFGPRKNKIPNYSTLLSVFEKPFKQKKKKEAQTKTETNKEDEAVEIEAEESPVEEIPPDVPIVLGKLRDFKFLQYRNHQPQPLQVEDKASKKMSADELCHNMILAMQLKGSQTQIRMQSGKEHTKKEWAGLFFVATRSPWGEQPEFHADKSAMFVVRKERATTTYGTCQYKSKVSVTFTKRREGDALLGVPPLVDCQQMVKAVCQTLTRPL